MASSNSEIVVSGLLLGLFIAISVGPTLFAVIRYSMHHTYKAGVVFVIGVSMSDLLYVTLANIATTWLEFLGKHQKIIGIIGSLLFIGMGLALFLKKYKPKRPPREGAMAIATSTYFKIWLSGFLMNTLNPAVVILWMGSAVKVATYTMTERGLFFGVCLGVVLVIDLCKVFLAEKIRSWLTLRKIMYLNKISAAFIFIFGVILLTTILAGAEL